MGCGKKKASYGLVVMLIIRLSGPQRPCQLGHFDKSTTLRDWTHLGGPGMSEHPNPSILKGPKMIGFITVSEPRRRIAGRPHFGIVDVATGRTATGHPRNRRLIPPENDINAQSRAGFDDG